jgi:hypothetical protein
MPLFQVLRDVLNLAARSSVAASRNAAPCTSMRRRARRRLADAAMLRHHQRLRPITVVHTNVQ